jgi:probable rRNA maturation factor
MTIDVTVQLAVVPDGLAPDEEALMERIDHWVRAALNHPDVNWCREATWSYPEPVHTAAQLTVRIVDEDEGTALNRDYRGREGATNVLSFPFAEPFMLQPPLLGDVVICAPILVEEARQQNKSLQAHWAHLVVHGVLHLLGYDHEDERQADVMETLEMKILVQLGFADPYQ